MNSRSFEISVNNKVIRTPLYIASFSSQDDLFLKNRIQYFINEKTPQKIFLISAYDYDNIKNSNSEKTELLELIKKSFKDKFLFLDNGGFELQFLEDETWGKKSYSKIIRELKPDFYCSYENPKNFPDVFNYTEYFKKNVDFFNDINIEALTVLLLHFDRNTLSNQRIDEIIQNIRKNENDINIIGFPDVEIGGNIIDRCRFIYNLRNKLDIRDINIPIHIFGCSNPLSILLYIISGADIFDGRGWFKYTFLKDDINQYDKSQLPLLNCKCKICRDIEWNKITNKDYEISLLMHNLYVINEKFELLRKKIFNNTFEDLSNNLSLKFDDIFQ